MNAGKDSARVRWMAGPFTTRVCVRTATGYRWAERPTRSASGYLDESQLRRLRAVCPCREAVALTPALAGDTAIWPEVATPELMADAVFGSGSIALRSWEAILSALGDLLAGVHSIPLSQPLQGFPRRELAAWRHEDPAATTLMEEARQRLPLPRAPLIAALARRAGAPPQGSTLTLVHGRFSTALCVPTSSPAMLGWREAGVGDPVGDLAFLVAELVEAAAVFPSRTQRLREASDAFLAGYEQGRGRPLCADERERLTTTLATRLVAHAAANVWHSGDHRGATELLIASDRALPQIIEPALTGATA